LFFLQPQVKDAVQDAAVLEEVLRMLLEIINSCIVNQVSRRLHSGPSRV
jgi:hypothetical protein